MQALPSNKDDLDRELLAQAIQKIEALQNEVKVLKSGQQSDTSSPSAPTCTPVASAEGTRTTPSPVESDAEEKDPNDKTDDTIVTPFGTKVA